MNITNDVVTDYISGLYRPLNVGLKSLRDKGEESGVPIILKDTETLMVNLLMMQKPQRILEIGAAIGYSASVMATVCPYTKIISIEKDIDMFDEARSNIDALGLSNQIWLAEGDARKILKDMKKEADEDTAFDFIFIDATKSHYREFFDDAVCMATSGSVVLCDNVLMKASTADDRYDPEGKFKTSIRQMREFLNYISGLDYAATSVLPVGDGVSITYIK